MSLPHEAVAGRERGVSGLEPSGDVSTPVWHLGWGDLKAGLSWAARGGLSRGPGWVPRGSVSGGDVSGEQTFPERGWKCLVGRCDPAHKSLVSFPLRTPLLVQAVTSLSGLKGRGRGPRLSKC